MKEVPAWAKDGKRMRGDIGNATESVNYVIFVRLLQSYNEDNITYGRKD
jgi:hypothetical protein